MIVTGTRVYWHNEPGLKGVVRSMSRWRVIATVEVTDAPAGNSIRPGLTLITQTESLREDADQHDE
jgi:hypothetical protein